MGFGLPGWPGGDPDALRDAARAWDTFADQVEEAVDAADAVVTDSLAALEGKAKQSFLTTWTTWASNQHKVADGARGVATSLESIADKIDEAHKKYEHIMEGLAAGAAAGIALGIVTFGIGTAVVDSAAGAAAVAAITALLETLGASIAAEAVAATLATMVGSAWVGFELTVSIQEGESIATGEGISMPDLSDAGVGALTGLLLPLAPALAPGAWTARLAAAGLAVSGTVAASELNGDGMPTVPEILASALLGGASVRLEEGLAAGEATNESRAAQRALMLRFAALENESPGTVAAIARDTYQSPEVRALAARFARLQQASESGSAFAALYKENPGALADLAKDPYQSAQTRALARDYNEVLSRNPHLLDDVPSLRSVLDHDPAAAQRAAAVSRELTTLAQREGLPVETTRRIWGSMAHHGKLTTMTSDGVGDFVKDWLKANHEGGEELERGLAGSAR